MNNSELIDLIKDTDKEYDTYCLSKNCKYDSCAIKKFRKDNDIAGIDCRTIFTIFKLVGENIYDKDDKGEKK